MFMQAAGFLCNIDNLGRIVIPAPIRKMYGLEKGDAIELFTDEDEIILRKYKPSCIFCGNVDDIEVFKGQKICKKCLQELKNT